MRGLLAAATILASSLAAPTVATAHGWGGMPPYGAVLGPAMMGGCGMMGPGYGMMRPGYSMMPPGYGPMATFFAPPPRMSAGNLKASLERWVAASGNPRLRLGGVTEDAEAVVAEVVTTEGALVDRLRIDKRSGLVQRMP